MNNMFPFIPQMYLPNQQNPSFNHIEEELKNMKQEINILKEKVKHLETSKKNNFLQKDDGFYMM